MRPPSSAEISVNGPSSPRPATGRVAGTAPAQRDRAVLPVRHGGGRAAPRRARQPEPPQRRALPRPRLAGQAADPRRSSARRSPPRARPRTGSRAHAILLVQRHGPATPLANGGKTGPEPSGVLQLGNRPALRRR